MKLKPLEASLFKPLDEKLRKDLILSGVVPVNDILLPHFYNTYKGLLLYGSWGSGKSVFFVDVLINKCIEDEYFRCYYGRKILETVRGTVFQTIIDRIKELKKVYLFSFSEAPNGTMNIIARANGNSFIPFGANNADSLKSIKDPTHFFCDELDQFSYDDFGTMFSRLRTEKAITQFFGAFNTEKVYKSHWIRKVLFDGEHKNQFVRIKVNYTDNYFIDQDGYLQKLRLIANGDAVRLNAIASGEWGQVRTGMEFWKQFDETRHVKPVAYYPGVIYASLDENVNPYVTITIWQARALTYSLNGLSTGGSLFQIGEILCKSPDNNAPKAAAKLCDYLDGIKHQDMVFVCGDPSASKRSTVDENSSSFYTKVIQVLNSRGYRTQNKVMKSAPEVALSAAFVNAIYENNLFGWSITIGDRCFASIEDYIVVKEDAEGKMAKPRETDPETKISYEPHGHISDTKRYVILTILAKEFELFKKPKSNLANKLGYFH